MRSPARRFSHPREKSATCPPGSRALAVVSVALRGRAGSARGMRPGATRQNRRHQKLSADTHVQWRVRCAAAPRGVIGCVGDGRRIGCTDFGLQFRRNRLFSLMSKTTRFAKIASIINGIIQPSKLGVAGSNPAGVATIPTNRVFIPTKSEQNTVMTVPARPPERRRTVPIKHRPSWPAPRRRPGRRASARSRR